MSLACYFLVHSVHYVKCPILQWWGEWKNDLESAPGTGSLPSINRFFRLVRSLYEICWLHLW